MSTLEKIQFCTFRVSEHVVGIDVQYVQEVLHAQQMRVVPLAPSEVTGLINLRGQIVTALDLGLMLGLSEANEELEGRVHLMNVVVRYNEEAVSLLVDEAGDVIEIAESDFEPVPSTVSPRIRRLVSGAFHLDESLVLVLDVCATVQGNKESPEAA